MSATKNTNPAGNPTVRIGEPVVKRGRIGTSSGAVRRKPGSKGSKGDFFSDLDEAIDRVKRAKPQT